MENIPENECPKTLFSEHDITYMQMVEALPDDGANLRQSANEIQDMSVGWYASPPEQVDSDRTNGRTASQNYE